MFDLVTTILCMCLTFSAAYTDMRYRKVPNILTFPAMIAGLLLCVLFRRQDLGSRVAMVIFFFFFGMLRWMGLGDIKLIMGMICLKGANIGLFSLLAGELFLLIYCLLTNREAMVATLQDTWNALLYKTKILKHSDREYPAAVFIALGFCAVMVIQWAAPELWQGGMVF